jgi:predicted metal-binding membrane protein
MTETMLEIILRRDRIIVAAALAALTAFAWTYVLSLAADMDMGGMGMTGFRMVPAGIGMMAPALAPWQAIEFVYVFAMWAVMMVGMMTPSAAPMILIYARVGRQASARGKPFAATGWFATGYLLAWVGFALVATAAQWALERTALLDQTMGALAKCSVGSFSLRPACTSGHRSRIYVWRNANRRSCSFSGRAGSIAIHRAHCCSVYVMALIALAAVGY